MEGYIKIDQKAFVYRFAKKFLAALIYALVAALFFGMILSAATNNSGWYLYIFLITILLFSLIEGLLIFALEANNIGYRIESNALAFRQGIFSVSKITIPFAKITNTSFDQSFFQRLFSVGDVKIDQEDSDYAWKGIDTTTANNILKTVSSKSNIQPIQSSKTKK